MGVDTRRPLLPAPTDSTFLDTTGGSATGTDLATDVSRRTDKTSYSIPDDGSPITISTRRRSQQRDREEGKVSRSAHHSQTSLLIEYFEAGKKTSGLSSRPSVRVRVTPSSSRKSKDHNDRIHISERSGGSSSGGIRKPAFTRRISLGTPTRTKELTDGGLDDRSISSLNSAADDIGTGRRPPLEIEFTNRDSEVSARYIQPTSDISSMPPDSSMLDGGMSMANSRRNRSHSISDDEVHEAPRSQDLLKTPSRRRSRSLSRERIAHKAAEKVSGAPRDRTRSKQRYDERNHSRELFEYDTKPSNKRSGKHRDRDLASPDSSFLSTSAVSGQAKASDQYSFRSGTSRSSLNNPKLLETVEDAIRRLILPELKELKNDHKTPDPLARVGHDTRKSVRSGSRDGIGRRLSKHASAPDVSNPRVVVSHEDPETPLGSPGTYTRRSKDRKRDKHHSPRQQEPSSRRLSVEHDVGDIALERKKSKGLRDAEAAKIVGSALTTAALKHHDSQSSMGSRGSKKKRNKTPTKGEGINDTELIFEKHDVPLMPLRSEIDSELTRASLLSHQSAHTATALEGEVNGGSLRNIETPTPSTPTRTSRGMPNEYGNHDSIFSSPQMDAHDQTEDTYYQEYDDMSPILDTAKYIQISPQQHLGYSHNRALSPIQSVASDEENVSEHEMDGHQQSHGSSPSGKYTAEGDQRLSIESLSSAASTDLARSTRTADYKNEKRPTMDNQHDEYGVEFGYGESPRTSGANQLEQDHADREYEHSEIGEEYDDESRVGSRRMTNYTDDSYDDPLNSGEQVTKGLGANIEYVHTPIGVESAVASLLDPSTVDMGSDNSPAHSVTAPLNRPQSYSPKIGKEASRDLLGAERGSPLKQQQNASSPLERSFHQRMGAISPPQSVANSSDEQTEKPILGATGLPTAGSPIPEIGHNLDSEESELNTNPSIIQGPIGGLSQENRDHWPYNPTPPGSKGLMMSPQDDFEERQESSRDLGDTSGGPIGAGLGVIAEEKAYFPTDGDDSYISQDMPLDDNLYATNHLDLVSPGVKDEGYISGANHRSTSSATPDLKNKGLADYNNNVSFESPLESSDPFNESHKRHLSGYSHGMSSPLYDGATGRGIDRIQSKDIVALMDHLTVRDAQRNARDTEMLVTLVRSAAEMRNSFENMKKFIAEQDELLIDTNNKQHDRTQKIVGGPRPLPANLSRSMNKQPGDDDDAGTKRKNVFKRALKNLSLKSSNDLTNIEDMLVHLLYEVEGLRTAQEGQHPRSESFPTAGENSTENVRTSFQGGYDEYQGQAGNSPPANQSGYNPNSPHRSSGNTKMHTSQRGSENRISPVQEENEDLEPLTTREQELLDRHMVRDPQLMKRHKRGGSVPLATPERVPVASGAQSNDTTPKQSAEKTRKHKSSNSSFFPKISRWSKTTASSMGENFRNSIQPNRKDRFSSEMSRSGSDLGMYNTPEYYDSRGDDRLRSTTSLNQDRQENRPPSPLVPSQLSEGPKYQAHRNSLNLQHPQPRQGPTARYQTHLESEAQNFGAVPMSPDSDRWDQNPAFSATSQNQPSSIARHRSPVSDGGYSMNSSAAGSQNGPPRPSKIRDEGPLIPQRRTRVNDGSKPSYAERIAMRSDVRSGDYDGAAGSPTRSSPNRAGPQRKLTGPRPITNSGKYGASSNVKRQQYRGSPNHVDDDHDY